MRPTFSGGAKRTTSARYTPFHAAAVSANTAHTTNTSGSGQSGVNDAVARAQSDIAMPRPASTLRGLNRWSATAPQRIRPNTPVTLATEYTAPASTSE